MNLAAQGRAIARDMEVHNAELPLRDAVQRILRAPPDRQSNRVALALHLSRLEPPAPRAHHRRIARTILDDAASRHQGQVFGLDNGDFVILLQVADSGAALATTLARLFQVDAPNPDLLLSRWQFPVGVDTLLAYIDASRAESAKTPQGDPARRRDPAVSLDTVQALEHLIGSTRITDLIHRQTAVLLLPTGPLRLRPLFREVTASLVTQGGRAVATSAAADPFLARYLAGRLDGRILQELAEDIRALGPLTGWMRGGRLAMSLNLSLPTVLSPDFAGFAAACQGAGANVAVELALLDACADPEAFLQARARLRLAGFTFVLDDVSHHALMMTTPAALQPDLVKLDWCPQVPEGSQALRDALNALGAARVVLHRADTEEALRWGLAHGVRRFQGRHVDAMLAAGRLSVCAHAPGCTLRQCVERETSASPAGRIGCKDLELLDTAAAPMVFAA